MANTWTMYTDPIGARVEVHADNGTVALGVPQTGQARDDTQFVTIPFDTGGMGAQINITAEGRIPFEGRGILKASTGKVSIEMDDFHLPVAPAPTPTPPDTGGGGGGEMPSDPFGIINWTYTNGHFDLSTKEGCGKFTEACCTNLHDNLSQMWGHIRKNPGQNQYNGHAVDAIQLAAGTGTGIYDIIYSSESYEAYPTYNLKGPADLSLWYYPA